jgi:hypothetical protein
MKKPYDEPGIAALALDTVEDAKRWGRAELAYYKSLAGERGADAGIGGGIGIAAVVLLQAAITALLVGLILTLSPRLGAGVSTLIVVAVALVIVAVLGAVALGRFRRVARPIERGDA